MPIWRKRLLVVIATAGVAFAAAAWPQTDAFFVAAFSALRAGAALPEHWRPLGVSSAKNATRYALVADDGVTVVRADAVASASALSRTIHVNPAEFPLLRWRWKVNQVIKNGDIHSKAGDDYAARVYVMFDLPLEKLPFADRTKLRLARALHDPNLPSATLCYVWDNKAPPGTTVPSSYTNLMRMIVVESGASRVNQWLVAERDIAADFKAAFGHDAPPISAVAIATDTDNTGETAAAFFGDISFNKQRVAR